MSNLEIVQTGSGPRVAINRGDGFRFTVAADTPLEGESFSQAARREALNELGHHADPVGRERRSANDA